MLCMLHMLFLLAALAALNPLNWISGIKEWLAVKGLRAVVPGIVVFTLGGIAQWLRSKGFSAEAEQTEAAIGPVTDFLLMILAAVVGIIVDLVSKARNVPITPKPVLEARSVEYAIPSKKQQK